MLGNLPQTARSLRRASAPRVTVDAILMSEPAGKRWIMQVPPVKPPAMLVVHCNGWSLERTPHHPSAVKLDIKNKRLPAGYDASYINKVLLGD